MCSRNLIALASPGIFRRLMVPGCGFGYFFSFPSPDLSSVQAPLRILKHWPLTRACLHQVTIGTELSSRAVAYNFGDCPALPNYSFKPNPLRGIACVPALRLHAFAATARVGLTQVLGAMRYGVATVVAALMLLAAISLAGACHGWMVGAFGSLALIPVSFFACINALSPRPLLSRARTTLALGLVVFLVVAIVTTSEGSERLVDFWRVNGIEGFLLAGFAYMNSALLSLLAIFRAPYVPRLGT